MGHGGHGLIKALCYCVVAISVVKNDCCALATAHFGHISTVNACLNPQQLVYEACAALGNKNYDEAISLFRKAIALNAGDLAQTLIQRFTLLKMKTACTVENSWRRCWKIDR